MDECQRLNQSQSHSANPGLSSSPSFSRERVAEGRVRAVREKLFPLRRMRAGFKNILYFKSNPKSKN